jgi:hypothetical protein
VVGKDPVELEKYLEKKSPFLKKIYFKECTFRPMYLCGGSPDFVLISIFGLLK